VRLERSIVPYAIVALGLSAWLHARGVSALVGERLGVPVAAARLALAAAPPPAPDPPRSADPILARNPFDSTTGPLGVDPGPGPAPGPETPAAVTSCPDVHVIAVAADVNPDHSLALLRYEGDKEPKLRGVGDEVVAIAPDGVLVDRGGRRCIARMFVVALPPGVATPDAGVGTPATPGVVSRGSGSYVVDRSLRDALLDGVGDWMRNVVVRPEKAGDDVVGIRIVTLRSGNPLEALGVRAGDVVQSVNGFPLTSPAQMLEALAHLRTADRLSVTVQRGGQQSQMDYEVR
jgi:general secretion pathway protein C